MVKKKIELPPDSINKDDYLDIRIDLTSQGKQVETLIEAAKSIIEKSNIDNPNRDMAVSITHLDEALAWIRTMLKDKLS